MILFLEYVQYCIGDALAFARATLLVCVIKCCVPLFYSQHCTNNEQFSLSNDGIG